MSQPTISKLIYRANMPTCSHCNQPVQDADDRVQRAGRLYHADKPACKAAHARAGSPHRPQRYQAAYRLWPERGGRK